MPLSIDYAKVADIYDEYVTADFEIRFCLPEREEFEELAASADFEVAGMYGDYDYAKFDELRSPFMIWRLKPNRH